MKMNITPHRFKGVYVARKGKKEIFLTKSLAPGKDVYGEERYKEGGAEYREWSILRSKLGAALAKNISQLGIWPGNKILYLGASTGTTVSHVSDVVGKEGFVFAVDFAPRTTRELVFLCEERRNIAPIIEDAFHPERYAANVCMVDTVFQDIAQRNQAEIFLKNCEMFLKKGGFGILAVKARSVDITKNPRQVFQEVRVLLEKKMLISEYKELAPFEKDHCIFVCKKIEPNQKEAGRQEIRQQEPSQHQGHKSHANKSREFRPQGRGPQGNRSEGFRPQGRKPQGDRGKPFKPFKKR